MGKKEKNNVPMELVQDEDIEKVMLDELKKDTVVKDETNVSVLDPNTLVKLKSEFEEHDEKISSELDCVSISYFNIGYELIYMSKMDLTLFGYKDLYDYGNAKYHFKATSIKNMMNVVKKCCIEDSNLGLKVKSEYEDFSYGQLVELLSVEDKDLIKFDSSMTIKQIRENKVLIKMNEYYCKEVLDKIKTFRDFVDKTFRKPSYILGIVIEPKSEEKHFLEMCDLLGECSIETVKNDISNRVDAYEYEVELKISYLNYKKFPFTIRYFLEYDSKIGFLKDRSSYSYWFQAPIYDGRSWSIKRYNDFKEIRKFFTGYLEELEHMKREKENRKLEKEKAALVEEKEKKEKIKFEEIYKKGHMCYGDNKKLLNSFLKIKEILMDASKKIIISDNDEVWLEGNFSYPDLVLRITDKYSFSLRYMYLREKNKNGYFFQTNQNSDYKTKEYYQMIFDFIKKSQTSDGKEKNEDKKV